jgi:hypothetical protein
MGPRRHLHPIIIEFGFWLALAGAALALTFQFSGKIGTYAWGAASWPRAVILLMALMALAQFVLRLYQRASAPTQSMADRAAGRDETPPRSPRDWLKIAAGFALPLAYVFLLPRAGFYVTTPFFLAAYLRLLGERRPAALVVCPLAIYIAINLVFTKLFYVALPTGNWPGFYDVSNWLIVTIR